MGCPFLTHTPPPERPLEYPYVSLYRPWSWMLSSFTNLFIFAALVGIAYMIYKKSRGGKRTAMYWKVEVKNTEEEKVNAMVIGGNGCLGKAIVKCLIKDGGYNIHSMDLWIPDEGDRNGEVCSYVQTDIRNGDDLRIALRGIDAVLHTASITPLLQFRFSNKEFFHINETGTKNVIEACNECGVKRLIYTSSATVVMSKDPHQKLDLADETHPLPDEPPNVYIASKIAAEKLVLAANGQNGLLTCSLRPAFLLGMGNPYTMELVNRRFYLPGESKHFYTIVPADAAASGHMLAEKKLREGGINSIAAGKVYNLSGDEKIQYREILDYNATKTTIWGHPPPIYVPFWGHCLLTYLNAFTYKLTGFAPFTMSLTPMGIAFLRDLTFSGALARKELGWEEIPPLREWAKAFVKEYREEMEKKKLK